jgi:2,3-bisphosphoglycerate-independent phosphoglycerate mutase
MDRDKRWDRVALAYGALVRGEGYRSAGGSQAVEEAYARGESDEFVKPTVVVDGAGEPRARVRDGDVIVFFNFRADRAREMTAALTAERFDGFERGRVARWSSFVGMTRYDDRLGIPAAFEPVRLTPHPGRRAERVRLRQLRIAETEKYAHVTYFFSGGVEAVFPGEERVPDPFPAGRGNLR